jgi:hypothetical protein
MLHHFLNSRIPCPIQGKKRLQWKRVKEAPFLWHEEEWGFLFPMGTEQGLKILNLGASEKGGGFLLYYQKASGMNVPGGAGTK